ncbi:MAG: exo-alpha-sialidase [Planctomycetes bacterium]|nr:exo-alpha-sialidase [Planctomycetota bacterium]
MATRPPLDLRKLSSSSEVYLCRDEGYFPVLVSPADNQILAVVRAGAGHVGITGRLDAVLSTDGGRTWGGPAVITDSEVDDRNPAVGIARDGSVVLAYHRQGSYDSDGKWAAHLGRVEMRVTRSRDGGRTWETPYPLGFPLMARHSAYGHIVTLADGTLLLPLYGWAIDKNEPIPDQAFLLRSRDHGRTWNDPSLIAAGYNETGLLLLPDGDLVAAIRSQDRDQLLAVCRSADGGRTWTQPEAVTAGREHPADLTLLSNGWILVVFGVRHEPFGVQALISRDGGRSWDPRRLVVTDDLGPKDLGYPSTVRLGRRLVTAYYSAPRTWNTPSYRGEGSFARALLYEEPELIAAFQI